MTLEAVEIISFLKLTSNNDDAAYKNVLWVMVSTLTRMGQMLTGFNVILVMDG